MSGGKGPLRCKRTHLEFVQFRSLFDLEEHLLLIVRTDLDVESVLRLDSVSLRISRSTGVDNAKEPLVKAISHLLPLALCRLGELNRYRTF